MRKFVAITLATLFLGVTLAATPGCIFHRHRRGHHHRRYKKKRKRCKGSHYWNGRRCVHRGKAKGHRRH